MLAQPNGQFRKSDDYSKGVDTIVVIVVVTVVTYLPASLP
jgi:hypothetical protein